MQSQGPRPSPAAPSPRRRSLTLVGRPMPRFSGITLAHNVREKAEVDAVLEQAAAAGARIEKPAQDTFWGGYAGYFSDPDGHLWEVAWGAFPFLDDGSLDIP